MALLQSMNVKAFKTFGDLAEHFIKCQQQCFPSAASVVDRQGILVELVCWHLLQETVSILELADHLSTERPCDHQKSWNVCLVADSPLCFKHYKTRHRKS
jgi:hypothetical protein